MQLTTRSLAVLMQVLLPKYLDGTAKQRRSAAKKMVEFVRALGKSVAEKRAIEGQGLANPEDDLPPPMSERWSSSARLNLSRYVQRHSSRRRASA